MATPTNDTAGLCELIKNNAALIFPDNACSILLLRPNEGYVAALARKEAHGKIEVVAKSACVPTPNAACQGLLTVLGKILWDDIARLNTGLDNQEELVRAIFNPGLVSPKRA